MRFVLVALIRIYRRFISPYKGFSCAYRVHTGHASCSALGLRAVRRHGAVAGLGILRRRLFLCGVAHRRHGPVVPRPRWPAAQRGECDCGDLPCDCDVCDGCNGCDWGSNKKKKAGRTRQAEAGIHIPPPRGF